MFVMIGDIPFLCLSKPLQYIGLDTRGQVICSAFHSFDIFDLSRMVKSSNKFFNKINKLVNKIKLINTVSEVIMSLPEIQVLKLNQHIINSHRHCSRGHAASVMNGNGDLSRGLNGRGEE